MDSEWLFELFCDGKSDRCGYDSLPLEGGGCKGCQSGSCEGTEEPSVESESFRTTFPTMGSNGGMTNGELVYQNSAFDLMAVTSVDNLGRPLATAYHPESVTLNGEFATPQLSRMTMPQFWPSYHHLFITYGA